MEERGRGEVGAGIHDEVVTRQKVHGDIAGRHGFVEPLDVVDGDLLPGDQVPPDRGDLRQTHHLRSGAVPDAVAGPAAVVLDPCAMAAAAPPPPPPGDCAPPPPPPPPHPATPPP